jgi:hypothetical protein
VMDRITRSGLAIGGGVAALILVGWLDGTVMRDAQHRQAQFFDPTGVVWSYSLGYLVTAASVLAVGAAGWWARSWVTGIVFLVGGAFFAFLDVITWELAASTSYTPAVLPEPLANAVSQLYFWQAGPIGSMRIVGAAVFLVGLLVIGSLGRARMSAPAAKQTEMPFGGESVRP